MVEHESGSDRDTDTVAYRAKLNSKGVTFTSAAGFAACNNTRTVTTTQPRYVATRVAMSLIRDRGHLLFQNSLAMGMTLDTDT